MGSCFENLGGVSQHRVEGGPIQARQAHNCPPDLGQPLIRTRRQPCRRRRRGAALDHIEELARTDINYRGAPVLGSPAAPTTKQGLVQSEPLDLANAVTIGFEQGVDVGNDDVVDGVPVTAQLASHVRNCPTRSADLNRHPAGRPIRQHPSSGASLDASEPTVGVVTAALGSRKPE
jgi:hypothetical protein